jgi:hypothetical protein
MLLVYIETTSNLILASSIIVQDTALREKKCAQYDIIRLMNHNIIYTPAILF